MVSDNSTEDNLEVYHSPDEASPVVDQKPDRHKSYNRRMHF